MIASEALINSILLMERDVRFLYVFIAYVCTNRMLIGKYDKHDRAKKSHQKSLKILLNFLVRFSIIWFGLVGFGRI
jgi:hypothetical protein